MPLLQLLHRPASSPLFWEPVSWKICLHWRRHSPRLAIPRGCEVYCVCERVVARARHVCWGRWHRPRGLWGQEVETNPCQWRARSSPPFVFHFIKLLAICAFGSATAAATPIFVDTSIVNTSMWCEIGKVFRSGRHPYCHLAQWFQKGLRENRCYDYSCG